MSDSSATESEGTLPQEFDPLRALHDARSPIEHVSLALGSADGLDREASRLTPTQTELLSRLASDPSGVKARAENQLRFWQERKAALSGLTAHYHENLPETRKATLGRLDPYLLEEMVIASGSSDELFVQHLMEGFPITGVIPSGGQGTPVTGGLRVHGRPGLGAPPPLEELQARCAQVNARTLARARAQVPTTEEERQLASQVWTKVSKDIALGRLGQPQAIESLDLSSNLLTDTFGVWETGAHGVRKVRVISNFRSNEANAYAWWPSRLQYDSFGEMREALEVIRKQWSGDLQIGKSDFEAAFKTLPAAAAQGWMCWALVYNTDCELLQVVPVQSQSFGSLGAVMAWHRTACLLQQIMSSLFGLVTFSYVDDFFWLCPADATSGVDAAWLQGFFDKVVSELLGWQLDPTKNASGKCVVLLGLEICLNESESRWRLHPNKAMEWLHEVHKTLKDDWLPPAVASKMCGRFSFLNSYVFGRVGRALLRPLIWRQHQTVGSMHLTCRLRSSLHWFGRVLEAGLSRSVPYSHPPLEKLALLYTDAESTGSIAAVLVLSGCTHYWVSTVPVTVRRKLLSRKTQIVAFELLAALGGLEAFCEVLPMNARLLHFIDSTSALNIVLKGASRQRDLNSFSGFLWYQMSVRSLTYWAKYVPSALNLADGPSRSDFRLMKALNAREKVSSFPDVYRELDVFERPLELHRLVA